MQLTRWLGSMLATLSVASAGLCAALVACDGDASSSTDADDSGLTDTMPSDAGGDGRDARASAITPRVTLVNAAHDLGPNSGIGSSGAIRLCFRQGSVLQNLSVVPYPPMPDVPIGGPPGEAIPGVQYGSGGPLPTLGLDFAGRIIVPLLMNELSLLERGFDNTLPGDHAATCDEILNAQSDGGNPLRESIDYWTLPAIQPGTLAIDKAYVAALTGCTRDAQTPNPGKCGPGFVSGGGPGLGTLKLTFYETTRAPVASPFGAQFLYLSTAANAFYSQIAAKKSIQPGFVANPLDGGFRAITDVNPTLGTLSPVVPVMDVLSTDAFVFGPRSLNAAEADAGIPLQPSALTTIQNDSELTSAYANGQNYVFIAVGDPDTIETKQYIKPDGTPGGDGGDGSHRNTRFFHFLAYPADP